MQTDDLIEQIARSATPVAPLMRPARSAARWTGGAALSVAVLVLARVLVSGGSGGAFPPWLLMAQVVAPAAAFAAAVAAFSLIIPGANGRVLKWPLVAGGGWLAVLAVAALREWPTTMAGPEAAHAWLCVAMIAVGSLLPVAAMVRSLRRGAPLPPELTVSPAVLAAASLSNVGACLAHPHSSAAVLVVWHGATVMALVIAGAVLGRSLLVWKIPALASEGR